MAVTYEASIVAVTPASSGPPTFSEIGGLISSGLTIRDELGLPGVATIDTNVDKLEPVVKARLRDLTVTPCELWIRRTTSVSATSIVSAGPITGYRISDRTITLVAPGLLNYLNYWLRDSDYTASGVDQATIVQQLVDQWQALAYGNDGIYTTGLTATGVTRDLNLSGRDGKYIMPVITEMGGRNNGFDLTVNPSTRALTMWSPRKGTDLTANIILDSRSIGTPDLSVTVAPGVIGSEVFASSNSTLGTTLTSIQSNTTLRSTFGRSYVSRQYQDISVQATLDDHAARTATDMGTQMVTVAPTLLPVAGFSYGDFTTGDQISYDFDAGLGRQAFTVRVASVEMTVNSGREMLTVGVV